MNLGWDLNQLVWLQSPRSCHLSKLSALDAPLTSASHVYAGCPEQLPKEIPLGRGWLERLWYSGEAGFGDLVFFVFLRDVSLIPTHFRLLPAVVCLWYHLRTNQFILKSSACLRSPGGEALAGVAGVGCGATSLAAKAKAALSAMPLLLCKVLPLGSTAWGLSDAWLTCLAPSTHILRFVIAPPAGAILRLKTLQPVHLGHGLVLRRALCLV